jgi:hypothetical protein
MAQKEKFSYKKGKAKLDKSTANYKKGLAEAKEKDRLRNEKKKRLERAKKLAAEADKKRSPYKLKKSVAVSTTRKVAQRRLKIPKRK